MASSLIVNALQVNFDSVLTFPEEGMVKMLALESTGLHGFLGCPPVLYEQDLKQFFSIAFVKENEVISAVQGKFVGISEELFAGAFGLPIAGLTDMTEVPKDLFYDARSIFSASGDGDQVIKASQGLCSSEEHCSPLILSGSSRRFRPSFWTIEVALDSSCEALSFHTSFGGCEGERQYRTLISLLRSLATMRRVVNYHSSWVRQWQVLTETVEVEDVETDLEEPVPQGVIHEEETLVENEKEKDKGKSIAQIIDSTDTEPLSKVLELTEKSTSDEESMYIDDILTQIPEEKMLPSVTAAEPTKITFGSGIEIREIDYAKAEVTNQHFSTPKSDYYLAKLSNRPELLPTQLCRDQITFTKYTSSKLARPRSAHAKSSQY
ncbi:hypothetical protein F511_31603 [Dorcoceras hygrometricum]|uniref:Uncharacterized protein n=1 Tax=Dorcoceras hygrometricum TaxID=472368 RepID=A0A2Z7AF14_9LAMI|nr:hypothetical protein F511_31603 [Dorcoceras hygrometricum]